MIKITSSTEDVSKKTTYSFKEIVDRPSLYKMETVDSMFAHLLYMSTKAGTVLVFAKDNILIAGGGYMTGENKFTEYFGSIDLHIENLQ